MIGKRKIRHSGVWSGFGAKEDRHKENLEKILEQIS